MAWGMSLATFTFVHVMLSVVGAGSGFGFPSDHLLPSHVVGVLSLAILAAAIAGRYGRHLVGAWRWIYVVGTATALYLNVFVGVVQAFTKVPTLHAWAPQQKEPPFLVLGRPGRYVETFVVDSWLEHLRQHDRVTVADRAIEERVRRFHVGEAPPRVSHLIAADPRRP